MARKSDGREHLFGGDWTTQKLRVLAGYLKSYTTALENKPTADRPFFKTYIDAFAGTGYRKPAKESLSTDTPLFPFPDLAEQEPQGLLDGSASLALQTTPAFDRYVFIERNQARCASLEGLKSEFPQLAGRIEVQRGEANAQIQAICRGVNWDSRRAVLFVDPYGMQVEWKTLVAVAETKAIDLWLLFPLGMGVNRLLTKDPVDMPESWRNRLDLLLGTSDWADEFYKVKSTPTLFGPDHEQLVKAKMETMGKYFNDRLKEVFAGVAEPGVLRNSVNNPLYLLCFAVGNERGKPIALRIAEHLLKGLK